MFKNLMPMLSDPCRVFEVKKDLHVYPIFKNGRSSVKIYAKANNCATYTDHQLSRLDLITVYLRTPRQRFASGVNTYLYLESDSHLDVKLLDSIERGDTVNKHFVPQYVWLLQLYKHYKGAVNLKPVGHLYDLIPNRDGPWTDNSRPWTPLTKHRRDQILSIDIDPYVRQDELLIDKYMGKTVDLDSIITDKELKDVLS